MICSCSKLCRLGVRFAILDVCHTSVKPNAMTNTNRYFTGHIPRKFTLVVKLLCPDGQIFLSKAKYIGITLGTQSGNEKNLDLDHLNIHHTGVIPALNVCDLH